MSTLSLVLFGVSLALMLGGMIYYIVVGSKGDLNPFKAALLIGGFVMAGLIVATIALMLQ